MGMEAWSEHRNWLHRRVVYTNLLVQQTRALARSIGCVRRRENVAHRPHRRPRIAELAGAWLWSCESLRGNAIRQPSSRKSWRGSSGRYHFGSVRSAGLLLVMAISGTRWSGDGVVHAATIKIGESSLYPSSRLLHRSFRYIAPVPYSLACPKLPS